MSLRLGQGRPAKFWLGFHKVLQNVCEQLGDAHTSQFLVDLLTDAARSKMLIHTAMTKDPYYFMRRPLSKVDYHYAANDVAMLCVIFSLNQRFIGDSLFNQCKEVSGQRAYEVADRHEWTELDKSNACRVPLEFKRVFAPVDGLCPT